MNELKEFLVEVFEKSLLPIKNYEVSIDSNHNINENIENLYQILNKMKTLSKFSNSINDDDSNLSPFEELRKFCNKLNNKMNEHKLCKRQKELFICIELVENLIVLDKFLPNRNEEINFKTIFKYFEKEYYKDLPEIEDQSIQAIEQWNYELLNEIMCELAKRADQRSLQIIKNIRQKLTRSLEKLLQLTLNLLKSHVFMNLQEFTKESLEKINKINNNLYNGIQNAEIVKEYININNFIEIASKEICNKFENMILDNLNEIESINLETKNFVIFEKKLKLIKQLIINLKNFQSNRLNKEFETLEFKKTMLIEELLNISKDISFEDHKNLIKLKKFLDNIEDLRESYYEDTKQIIIENLKNKLNEQIILIYEKNNDYEVIKNGLNKLKKLCGDKLHENFTLSKIIENNLQEVENSHLKKCEELESYLSQNKFEQLNKFIKENNMVCFVSMVSKDFNKKFDQFNSEILVSIKNENNLNFFSFMIEIEILFENFSKIIENETKIKQKELILEINNNFQIKIKNAISLFSLLDSENKSSDEAQNLYLLNFLLKCFIEINETQINPFYFEKIKEDLSEFLNIVSDNYAKVVQILNKCIDSDLENFEEMKKFLSILKRWENLLYYLSQYKNCLLINNFSQKIHYNSYQIIIKNIKQKLDFLRENCMEQSSEFSKEEYGKNILNLIEKKKKLSDTTKYFKEFLGDLEKNKKHKFSNSLSASTGLF